MLFASALAFTSASMYHFPWIQTQPACSACMEQCWTAASINKGTGLMQSQWKKHDVHHKHQHLCNQLYLIHKLSLALESPAATAFSTRRLAHFPPSCLSLCTASFKQCISSTSNTSITSSSNRSIGACAIMSGNSHGACVHRQHSLILILSHPLSTALPCRACSTW